MKKISMRTPGGKTTTWTQTRSDAYVGILTCDGCGGHGRDVNLRDAKDHAAQCRVISVEEL